MRPSVIGERKGSRQQSELRSGKPCQRLEAAQLVEVTVWGISDFIQNCTLETYDDPMPYGAKKQTRCHVRNMTRVLSGTYAKNQRCVLSGTYEDRHRELRKAETLRKLKPRACFQFDAACREISFEEKTGWSASTIIDGRLMVVTRNQMLALSSARYAVTRGREAPTS